MFKLKKFFCLTFVFLFLFLSVLSVSADSWTTVPDDQLINQPGFFDISYLPAMPQVYLDANYKYKVIFFDILSNTYSLILHDKNLKIQNTFGNDWLFPADIGYGGTFIFYKCDMNIKPAIWVKQPNSYRFYINNQVIFFTNFDIKHDTFGQLYAKKQSDFISSTVALSVLQTVVKKYLFVLVPFGITIFTAFILLRILTRLFKPKDRYKSKMYKQKLRMKGKRFLK